MNKIHTYLKETTFNIYEIMLIVAISRIGDALLIGVERGLY